MPAGLGTYISDALGGLIHPDYFALLNTAAAVQDLQASQQMHLQR